MHWNRSTGIGDVRGLDSIRVVLVSCRESHARNNARNREHGISKLITKPVKDEGEDV